MLFESSATKQQNSFKNLREKGYNETLNYYKSLDKLSQGDLESNRKYTTQKILDAKKEVDILKGRNLILKNLEGRKFGMTSQEQSRVVANEAEKKANDERIKDLANVTSSYLGQVAAINSLLEPKKKSIVADKEMSKSELKLEEDRLKAIADARKKELQLELANIDTRLNNEDSYYTDRLTALDEDFLKRVEIAKVDHEEENRLAKGNQEKQKIALINFQLEKIKLIESYNKQKSTLEALDLDPVTKQATSKLQDKDPLKTLGDSAEHAVKGLEKAADRAEKLRFAVLELQAATNEWLKSFSSEFLQNSGFGSLETFFDGSFKNLLAGAETTQQKFAVYFNAIAESAQEAFNFIADASQKNFDDEKNRLQSQYDIALVYAGDNKAAQEKLGEDLEKQKKEIANRENKAKQKQAIFNIGIDTAQAIVGLWANPGFPAAIPLAIGVAALGAIQIGLVASQEVPQYFMGGTHDGGLMMVNDGAGANYKETIVTPDGKIMKPQGRNVLMNAPAGTEIYTHDMWQDQLQSMLQGKGIEMSASQHYSGITKGDMYQVMQDTLGSQPQYHSNFDADGATDYIIKGGNKTIINKNRGNGRGSKFN